ncbi:hypothetical protein BAE44_0012524 [Dichanthelium oligosanthes]|uniref:Uncharacterized protein n=1 Tax=Dichanthelium oligosanthes TaxID=888268 RepID=A0A1E5VMV5_9POAL|nr:hypothetical protein BAE44_0012524 [Dichanthelium oligosanthes]
MEKKMVGKEHRFHFACVNDVAPAESPGCACPKNCGSGLPRREGLQERRPAEVTMATVPSQTQEQEVGGSSGGPPSISSSATKRKWPPVMDWQRDSAAKRVKSPTAGNKQRSVTSSQLKRSAVTSKQIQSAAKRFEPPMVGKKLASPLVTRSPVVTCLP